MPDCLGEPYEAGTTALQLAQVSAILTWFHVLVKKTHTMEGVRSAVRDCPSSDYECARRNSVFHTEPKPESFTNYMQAVIVPIRVFQFL